MGPTFARSDLSSPVVQVTPAVRSEARSTIIDAEVEDAASRTEGTSEIHGHLGLSSEWQGTDPSHLKEVVDSIVG
jgi:hypothetical protein